MIIWLAIQLGLGCAWAETRPGFSFLKIGVGARAVGLGSAYTALSNDVTSIYWNPAGLSSLNKQELSAMHSDWLAGRSFDFLGYGRPVKKNGALAISLSALSHPELEERDEAGRKLGGFTARDSALSLAYSRSWAGQIKGGMGLKFIQSQIGQDKGQGLALDLGSVYHLTSLPLSLGTSLRNLGPGIRFINERTRLPLTASLGGAYHILPGLAVAADIRQQIYERQTTLSLGTEYTILPVFTLRGGYLLNNSNQMLNGLGGGFGLRISGYRIDYAFSPFGELGNTHRLSLTARF